MLRELELLLELDGVVNVLVLLKGPAEAHVEVVVLVGVVASKAVKLLVDALGTLSELLNRRSSLGSRGSGRRSLGGGDGRGGAGADEAAEGTDEGHGGYEW